MSIQDKKINVVFLGGAFFSKNKKNILDCSTGAVQNAADSLQKKYIAGITSQESVGSVYVINLPFIGAYKKGYKKCKYKPVNEKFEFSGFTVQEVGFLNLPFIRLISRFFNSLYYTYKILNKYANEGGGVILICYSMHLPFLATCFLLKFIFKSPIYGLVVPDLPEFMAERKGFKKHVYLIGAKLSKFLSVRFDFFVPITQQMGSKLGIEKFCVIEGICEDLKLKGSVEVSEYKLNTPSRYFLYSGTLDSRYGIADLIRSFSEADTGDFELVICGLGDYEFELFELIKRHSNVHYFGQLTREEVLFLQSKASLLINPRNNSGDFTKYSFPSKVLEYMSSGTPVLMYKLDGIPDEYYSYCYLIDDYPCGFKQALNNISIELDSNCSKIGHAAKKFVLEEKNSYKQVNKLFKFIGEKFDVQR